MPMKSAPGPPFSSMPRAVATKSPASPKNPRAALPVSISSTVFTQSAGMLASTAAAPAVAPAQQEDKHSS